MKAVEILIFSLGFAIGNPEARKLLMKAGNELGTLVKKELDKAKASYQKAGVNKEELSDA